MGINDAFSSWLRGAQSLATSTLRTAQGYGAALQQQTMTALSTAQRAVTQPFQPQTQTPQRSSAPAPYTVRTATPVDYIGEAGRAVSGGVRAAQEAVGQIVRNLAPIPQGIQRDVGRIIPLAPQRSSSRITDPSPAPQGGSRSIPGAGAPQRSSPQIVRAPPTATPQSSRSIPGAGIPSPAQTSAAALDQMVQRHKTAVQQYGIEPEIRQYEQKRRLQRSLRAARACPTGDYESPPEHAGPGWGSRIDARKRQELAGIRVLEANIQMLAAPMRAEAAALRAESARLQMDAALRRSGSRTPPSPGTRPMPRWKTSKNIPSTTLPGTPRQRLDRQRRPLSGGMSFSPRIRRHVTGSTRPRSRTTTRSGGSTGTTSRGIHSSRAPLAIWRPSTASREQPTELIARGRPTRRPGGGSSSGFLPLSGGPGNGWVIGTGRFPGQPSGPSRSSPPSRRLRANFREQ